MGHNGSKRSVLIYLPEDLHRWLKVKAALEGRSMSAVIENAARDAYPDAPSNEISSKIMEETIGYGFNRPRKRKKTTSAV